MIVCVFHFVGEVNLSHYTGDLGVVRLGFRHSRVRGRLPQAGESELSAGAIDALFILGQAHLFSGGRGIEWSDLAQILGKSRNTVRAYLVDVEQERLVERTSSRPLRVRLSEAGKALLFPGHA